MGFADNTILQYESSLSREALRRIRQIESTDLLIGIPSHRNGRTLGEVMDALVEGVATYLSGYRVVLMNADGGSSDNTIKHLVDAALPDNVQLFLTQYEGLNGKGTAIRSILETAGRLKAAACLVVEARAPGIKPEWFPALINPILQGDQMVMGCYHRHAYDASLTENLAYPFLRVFLGAELREPLAPEFCVSGELAMQLAACDVWETHVARFGVNAWLSIYALTEHLRLAQVDLGYRGLGGGEPAALGDLRYLHTFGTLFRMLIVNRRTWQALAQPTPTPFRGGRAVVDQVAPVPDHVELLVGAFREGLDEYLADWRSILQPQTREQVLSLAEQPLHSFAFPVELWVRVIYEFATVYNKGEGDPDQVVEALLPIYYARTAAYIHQTRGLTPIQREPLVQEIVDALLADRPYFARIWDAYQDWEDDVTRHWLA